ncbi:MAG: HAMP domain-containing sensor histidine kinase [Eubacteriales bacterium]|nr:HAMP domain-containing sensor histidine kinase [Eubacteriales bacterium]
MIQKLRVRFIILAMSTLLTVLVVLVGGIDLASYRGIVAEADRVLSGENLGRVDKKLNNPGKEANGLFSQFSPDEHNYVRFFSVIMSQDGQVLDTQIPLGAIMASDEVSALAAKVFTKEADTGFQSIYRYSRLSDGDTVRIRFLDCGREISSFRQFLLTSVLLSAVGLLLIFAVVVYFSGRIVRPFAESYEKQKQFITDAGHEIKTPLTIIQADADVLEMELGENEWLADIQSNVRRLTNLTSDLVSLARMEEGGTPMELLEIPVSDVVAETAQSFHTLAQAQRKELQITVQPMLSMEADEKAIAKLVGILLDNALKYSPEGTAIGLSLCKHAKQLKLTVRNVSAVPLPEGDLDRLFERFYRADPSRNSQTGGHGIGLSIAAAIAAAHNGQIHASQPENGSLQITVTLPQRQRQTRKAQ